ncbi:MAG TPA: hypothetical protein VLT33_08655, partial [Labilithrix sp.]|nr:hypothetical protein [Labilithrix sp.]
MSAASAAPVAAAAAAAADAEQPVEGEEGDDDGDQFSLTRRANSQGTLPGKRGRKKSAPDAAEDDEDGEFEVPRSLRYPRGVS